MTGTPTQAWATNAGLFPMPNRQLVVPETIAARLAINELFARYGIAHDEIDLVAFGEVFADDGILEVSIAGPVFERHRGRAEIIANFERVAGTQSDQRRHAITNIELSNVTETSAEARAYGIVTAADPDGVRVTVSCCYTADVTLCTDGLWRFARLWIGMDFYTGHAPGTD